MAVAGADVGPPPGFEEDDREPKPAPPEVPPEPSFRAKPDSHVPQGEPNSGLEEQSRRGSGQERQETTRNEWRDSEWSAGDRWHASGWGDAWDSAKYDDPSVGWGRRASWESATTGVPRSGGDGGRSKRCDDDPWDGGCDPWSNRGRRGDHREQQGWPRADGRDGRPGENDQPDHRRQWWDFGSEDVGKKGQWTDDHGSFTSGGFEDNGIAWSGWSHFGNGGFKGDSSDRGIGGRTGQGRPSERLSVPTFHGDDSEDLGGSARSYLRQIEAWRRMTLLPPEQQALVLYQNLGGKAWVAAEELSVAKLASPGGVSYYVSWITARFLDLEVARIGKAFSDFFRRLRRKSGQSIREYNTEYDRLYARLREVGCQLPEDCAAWLYIDRLQLEEAQELNLLASVGNQYSLHKLQQAAVLHDRGHRKPWEQGKGRKTHTAHVTSCGAGDYSDSEDDGEFGDGVPEEVAQAFLTYQTAKNRYKEQAKNRGYQANGKDDNGERDGKRDGGGQGRDERLKKLKSKSYCASCGRKGHWHKDPECPNHKGSGGTDEKNVRGVEVCHHVPAEVMTLKHEGEALVGITDTACAKSVAGTSWLQRYSDLASRVGEKVDLVKECEAFRFGTGKIHYSAFNVKIKFTLGTKLVCLKVSVINGDVPLLMSKKALAQLGMIYDVARNTADFSEVGLKGFVLLQTTSGHPAIPICPAKAGEAGDELVLADSGPTAEQQYTAFVVSDLVPSTPKPYKIFYDKKLSPEVKQMLTQDYLSEASFVTWWNKTNIDSDFWVEGELAWHRVHVTPRRSLFSPFMWKTHGTVQKDMLLSCIGKFRVTEGFCSRTGKPLESAADVVEQGCEQPSFPLFWFGRTTFAKATSHLDSLLPPRASEGHEQLCMATPGHQQDEQGAVARGSEQMWNSGSPSLDHRGDQSGHTGAPHGERPHDRDEVYHQPHPRRAESEGQDVGSHVRGQDNEREPHPPHPRPHEHPRPGVDEDWEVQGVRVRGDSGGLRSLGLQGDSGEFGAPPGAGSLRQVVRREEERHLRGDQLRRGELRGPFSEGTGGTIVECRVGRISGLERGAGDRRLGSTDGNLFEDDAITDQAPEREGGQRDEDRPGQDPRGGDCGLGKEAGRPQEEDRGCQGVSQSPAKLGECGQEGGQPRLPSVATDGHHDEESAPIFLGEPHPGHRQGSDKLYDHEGNHFGNKTIVKEAWCCGGKRHDQPGEEFIADGDFAKGHYNQHGVYVNNPELPGHAQRPHLQRALRECDYTFSTIQSVLNETNIKLQRNTKGKALGSSTHEVLYQTLGLYTHGGVFGVTTRTKSDEDLGRYLNAAGRYLLPEGAKWSSVTITKGCQAEPHHDYNNMRGSENYVFTVGGKDPGYAWIETKGLDETEAENKGVKWKNINGRGWTPGHLHRTLNNVIHFDPFLKHATHEWDQDKWCVIYHTTKSAKDISPELRKYLKNLGFPVGSTATSGQSKDGAMPKKSTRKAIFSNAAKISVMLASIVAATDSYLNRGVFAQRVQSPIVMFEIGEVCGTEDAVKLDKDVFEPMTWESYHSSEGKETAYHIVHGGYPRELRVSLKGKRPGDSRALRDLVETQIDNGGTAVVIGDSTDEFFEIMKEDGLDPLHCRFRCKDKNEITVVYYKEKTRSRGIAGADRIHEVCVVDDGGQGKGRPHPLGGSAIKFERDTPPAVAASLRRLHQNLGHPRREDLLRHLRLAGCSEEVLKAAKTMTCDVCAATGGPKSQRPSALPHMYDFGDVLGIDIFYAHDADDVKHTFLSVADYGTTFHQVMRVDGQSAGDIEEAFNTLWIVPYGAPKTIAVDLDGGLQTGLARLCDWHGIEIRSVAAQGHWQAGVVERQQAWWKNVWERIVHELTITEDEVDIAVPIVSAAKNDLRRRCGFSPSQWIFGKGARLPEDLRDPDSGERVTWDVSGEARFQRQSLIRASARVAFHRSQVDSRLRKALLQRARTTSRQLEVGESVHFWHQRKDRRRGQWEGPGVIVGTEGNNYWISRGGRCRLKAPEHVRPSSPEEIGEYFVVKELKREVEKLLEGNPDDPEVFEDNEDDADGDEDFEDMLLDPNEDDEGYGAGDIELGPPDDEVEAGEILGKPPLRRLKRKTKAADLPDGPFSAMMLKTDLTRRGVEKRKEKELRWAEIPQEMKDDFRAAEVTQWNEHLAFDALVPLDAKQSAEVRKRVDPSRILRSRWAYKDKNYARRREGEQVGWKCKSRLVIAGHTDPDLGVEALSTDAPTLSRAGLACLMQKVANGLALDDAWHIGAGDIRCAFLTGSYLKRELYIHQPATGFPGMGMNPGDLVRVKKNVFGLATSPHEWWLDLQNGIYETQIKANDKEYRFEQCALDPCIFMLKEYIGDAYVGTPKAYIGCHVDDILIAAPESLMKAIQSGLSATFPIEKWEDDEFEFLGSSFSIRDQQVCIDQEKYASTRLFTLDIFKGVFEEELAPPELIADNRSLIGALSWMSAQSRPDLTCSVSMAQQLQQRPCYGDLKFTNSVATKAHDYKSNGLRFKAVDEKRMMILCYHDAAWANVPEPDNEETYYKLTYEDDQAGLQREAPESYYRCGRKAKRGASRVASQLGCLVLFADRGMISGEPGTFSIADWKSRAGQRVCRSTFGAETQACVEGLETGQYMRSMYETLKTGQLVSVPQAVMPILCLSDCRSLFDHLTRQGVPRVPSDKRLAVDLAALRQSLKSERINSQLPVAWIPGETQLGDVLTKPQNPASWWERIQRPLLIPIGIADEGCLISDKARGSGTSVKPEVVIDFSDAFPYEFFIETDPRS